MLERVPVMCGLRCIELAGPARVARLAQARNATVIVRRRDRKVVEIQLAGRGNDERKKPRKGNPLAYSYRGESEQNPQNVWALKEIPTEARSVFGAVVNDCAA